MPRSNSTFAAIALGAICLSCSFFNGKLARDPYRPDSDPKVPQSKLFDRNAPLVSPGAVVARRLAELDPSLTKFVADIETVERAALTKAIEELPGESGTDKKAQTASLVQPSRRNFPLISVIPGSAPPTRTMLAADSMPSYSDRASAAGLVGALIAGVKDIFTRGHTQATDAAGVKAKQIETKDGTKTTMGAELQFNKDGSSTFGLEYNTDAEKDGGRVASQFKARVEGLDCPDPQGNIHLKANIRLGGESGGTGYTQEVDVTIKATVDDEANLGTVNMDYVQGIREVINGKGVYIETGFSTSSNGVEGADYEMTNWRLNRHSQGAADDIPHAKAMAEGGQEAAVQVAWAVLRMAEHKWQGGGCVKIDAVSPGKVDEGSTQQIPVKVVHKFDGADVPSKLTAELSGGSSIDPALIPKTAGTLTYVAPGESGQTATIKLKSASRRGRATLDLTASTGGMYTVDSQSNNVSFTGKICGSKKTFTLNATFPGGTSVMTFNPGGSMSSSGSGSGCTQTGSGTYTITENPDGSGTLSWSSQDTVNCPMGFSNSRSNKFSVPLKPSPEGKCQ